MIRVSAQLHEARITLTPEFWLAQDKVERQALVAGARLVDVKQATRTGMCASGRMDRLAVQAEIDGGKGYDLALLDHMVSVTAASLEGGDDG